MVLLSTTSHEWIYIYGTLLLCLNKSVHPVLLPIRGRMYSWNFTSGISSSAEGAFAWVGGIFTLSPGGFSPLEPSLLFSPVSMSQSRLLSWKQRELIALIHCLFFIYTIFYTVESHWIHQNNKARYIELCIKQMCEIVLFFQVPQSSPPLLWWQLCKPFSHTSQASLLSCICRSQVATQLTVLFDNCSNPWWIRSLRSNSC